MVPCFVRDAVTVSNSAQFLVQNACLSVVSLPIEGAVGNLIIAYQTIGHNCLNMMEGLLPYKTLLL